MVSDHEPEADLQSLLNQLLKRERRHRHRRDEQLRAESRRPHLPPEEPRAPVGRLHRQ